MKAFFLLQSAFAILMGRWIILNRKKIVKEGHSHRNLQTRNRLEKTTFFVGFVMILLGVINLKNLF